MRIWNPVLNEQAVEKAGLEIGARPNKQRCFEKALKNTELLRSRLDPLGEKRK